MAVRRTRPPHPLAPHGIPGHLVEFVEGLRKQGISVGPSETVDAGRVLSVLGLGDREALREGLACAVLRRSDHRDTYDAMFDLFFPAALGAKTVLPEDDEQADGQPGLPPEDIEALRAALVDMLTQNEDLATMDERLTAMIAQIVTPSLVPGLEIFYFHDAYYRGLIGRTLVLDRAAPAAEIADLARDAR